MRYGRHPAAPVKGAQGSPGAAVSLWRVTAPRSDRGLHKGKEKERKGAKGKGRRRRGGEAAEQPHVPGHSRPRPGGS